MQNALKLIAATNTVVFALFCTSPALGAGIFNYRAGNIPKSYGTCETLKDNITAQFRDAAHVNIISSKCVAAELGSSVEITYSSELGQPAPILSTRDLNSSDANGRGYLETEEQCEAFKNDVVRKFKSATYTDPFLVYCTKDRSIFRSTHPWHVAIDAVGTSEFKYFFSSQVFNMKVVGDRQRLLEQVYAFFSSRPDTVLVDAVLRNDSTGLDVLGVSAFSKSRTLLTMKESVTIKLNSNCEDEARAFGDAASLAGIDFVATGCHQNQFAFHNVPFMIFADQKISPLNVVDSGIQFTYIADCKSSREATFKRLQGSIGNNVVGVLCDESQTNVRAFAVLKK
jgi:hypothetical protein